MSLSVAAPSGRQTPRISSAPDGASDTARELIDFAGSYGLDLDPWQRYVLEHSLRERGRDKWSAFEVGVIVSRQNGKGALLEARELGGLFLLGEKLVIHTAHEFKTAAEGFVRVKSYIDNYDHLRRRVKLVRTGAGTESIELLNGNRLRFVARSAGSGRGFSGDCVLLDEAYALTDAHMAALLPTLSARPNPQVWYTSSAGTDESRVLRRVRERALARRAKKLAYFEWSAAETAGSDEREAWADANPALGIRIGEEFIAAEREAMSEPDFRRERLGIWAEDGDNWGISLATWSALTDPASRLADPVAFAIDMPWDRSSVTIAAGGLRDDGLRHGEIIQSRPGTGWVVRYVAERVSRWRPAAVVLDGNGPAASFAAELDRELSPLRVPLVKIGGPELAQACGSFYDAVMNSELRHLDDEQLATSVAGARKSDRGDVWRWDRKDGRSDISPLMAVTMAIHGAVVHGNRSADPSFAFVDLWGDS